MMEDPLHKIYDIVDNHDISLSEEDVLGFLQMYRRWPLNYKCGQPSVEVITEYALNSKGDFFDHNGLFLYDRWKRCYDVGFTTIMSNILDLTSQLRELNEKIFPHIGHNICGNLYFSSGTTNKRVSFPPHDHHYHVIVKPIYGKATWQINGEVFKNSTRSIIIPAGASHSVNECPDKKLSLTLNII